MTLYLMILSGCISLAGTVPYIVDTIKGKTKPRLASWLVWGLLTGIAALASFSEGHYPAAVLATCMTASCILVAVIGVLKNGTVSLEKFDVTCLLLAAFGIVLWQLLDSPAIAIIAVVAIDAIASLPTVRHAWKAHLTKRRLWSLSRRGRQVSLLLSRLATCTLPL